MVKFLKLGEVCLVRRGTSITRKDTLKGDIPVIGGGRKATYYHNKHNRESGTITISGSGASAGLVNYWSVPIFASDCSTVELIDNKQNIKFVYYYLQLQQEFIYKKLISGAAQPHVYAKDIANLSFPLLSIKDQMYIVAKLDVILVEINRLNRNIKAQEINVKRLFEEHLLKTFNNESYNEYELGSICDFVGGSQPPKSNFEYEKKITNIRFIQIRDYKNNNYVVYIPKNKAKRFCNKTDVMIGRYGPPIFQILRGIEGSYNVALMKAVPKKKILNDYLFYFLQNKKIQDYIIKKSIRAAGQSGVNKQALEPYKINLPSITEQKKLIDNVIAAKEETIKLNSLLKKKIELNIKLKSLILKDLINNNKAA